MAAFVKYGRPGTLRTDDGAEMTALGAMVVHLGGKWVGGKSTSNVRIEVSWGRMEGSVRSGDGLFGGGGERDFI